jgi:hypothetical protein
LRQIIRRSKMERSLKPGRVTSAHAVRQLKQMLPSRVTDALRHIAQRYRGPSQ